MATYGDPAPMKPPPPARGASGYTYVITSETNNVTSTGSSIGGYYGGAGYPGYVTPIPIMYPSLPQAFPNTVGVQPFLDVLQGTRNRLTPAQLATLVAAHDFVPMDDGNDFCLFCFALDLYRGRLDHQYVIHED